MANVVVDKQKIDLLANAIADKSGEPVTMTLDEMVEAVDGIQTGGSAPVMQTKTASYTPTETQQTDSVTADVGYDGMDTVNITVGAISSTYVGSGITQRSSSDLTASGATVTVPSGYYSAQASKAVASGTAGTPTATKGTVSNHSVSVTPSVTNTTGYITGSTKTGTAVTVSASELVSGSETKTANGTYDVTNLAEIVVNVQGTASSVQVDTVTASASSASTLQFSGLNDGPTSFIVTSLDNLSASTYPIVSTVCFDGTTFHGQAITSTSNANVQYLSSGTFNPSYNSGTLTISVSGAEFNESADYKLVYTYGGSSSDIHTENVQVGSGATSITFPVVGRPIYWSCIFKSDFGTSSGYQRVITAENDGTSIYGLAMDSSAHPLTVWTATYSGGNLTITSQGTNNGGYFHQPGYYQLTYAIGETEPVEIEVEPLSVTTNGTYTAPTGKAYSPVTVNVSGGSSKNAQVVQQNNTRVASTSYTKACGDITVSKTGTYDVYWTAYRTSTSGTWGTQLYINGADYGNAQTTFSSYYQTVHLSNVSLTANQEVSVYGRSRGSNYYLYVGQLTIIES